MILDSMLGCVERRLFRKDTFPVSLSFSKGFSIHIAATVCFLIDSIVGSFAIFCSAEIIAWLSFVSSTAPASARYSLFLESASLISGKRR